MSIQEWKRELRRGGAFTLIELLVVMAVISVLASLGLPSLARAKERARTAQCLGNLRQWTLALSLYTNENEDCIPRRGQGVQPLFNIDRPEDWFNALPPFMKLSSYRALAMEGHIPGPGEKSVYVCPAARPGVNTNFLSYAMNIYLSPTIRPMPHRMAEIADLSSQVFMADGPCDYSSTAPSKLAYSVQARHVARGNIAFLDGHIQNFTGKYLGCGVGDPGRTDVRWQTGTSGINQERVP